MSWQVKTKNRFAHEFLRATPKPFLGLSGYQLIALATAFAALMAYRSRAAVRSDHS